MVGCMVRPDCDQFCNQISYNALDNAQSFLAIKNPSQPFAPTVAMVVASTSLSFCKTLSSLRIPSD